MGVKFANNARTSLSSDITSAATSISVSDASVFPTIATGDYFYMTLENLAGTSIEIVKVTAVSGNTLTVTRAQDNTTAAAFSTGDKAELRVTVASLEDATSVVHVPGGTGDEGLMTWNTDEATVDVYLSADVTLQLGQELHVFARNESGSTITNGTVVKVTGASGNKPTIELADASTEGGSAPTIGVATQDFSNNSSGYITTAGLVRGLNTSSFTEGVPIYLGSNGTFTATQPTSPNHLVHIGWVTRSHATEGAILVHVNNGWEIDELHDVLIGTKTNGDLLRWNSASSVWENFADGTGSNLDADQLDGQEGSYYLNYTNFTNTPTNVSTFTNDAGYLTAEVNNLTTSVTWANVPDANITQSSVTQHQAALSITESQISDLQSYLTSETNDLTVAVTWANVPDANITQSSVTQHQAALSITESQISDFSSHIAIAIALG